MALEGKRTSESDASDSDESDSDESEPGSIELGSLEDFSQSSSFENGHSETPLHLPNPISYTIL